MFQRFTEKPYKREFDKFSGYDVHSISSLIERGQIPVKQKQTAANYLVIRKIFGFSAVHSRISNSELNTLKFAGMKPLEETTCSEMLRELEILKNQAKENDFLKNRQADEIFEIRVKELRFLKSDNSPMALAELCDGYVVLEKYLEYIAS